MTDDHTLSRRRALRTGGALLALGAAGCTGDSTDDPTPGSEGGTPTPADTPTPTDTASPDSPTEDGTSGGYTVSIEPMGEVAFDAVPETWVANNGSWADMGIALGLEPPEGVWLTNRYHTHYYDEIPGVSVDGDGITDIYQDGVDMELFYAFDADVHVMDPNFMTNRFDLTDDDVTEIERIAPLFGNTIFSRGYPWHEDYRYYTLYEAFEKLAAVFQREDRFEAFATLHEEFQSELEDVVPSVDERPEVAFFWASGDQPDEFYPYRVDEGTSFKQWRDLGVEDALATEEVQDFIGSRAVVDYETLLEVDPQVLLIRGQEQKSEAEFQETLVAHFESHDVASSLTAVQNGDVYQAGPLYQGPIFNLLLTERAAKQVYDVDRELFDRERVAAIVDGDV